MPKRPADISNAPQRIRIVSGSLRGSKIDVVDVPGLRPTPDRVRETLFNWLAPVIDGMRCLDLYAGTGALGIEAISRGASSCTFVERDPRAAATLTVTLARLKVENADVTTRDAMAFLNDPQGPFDLVFLDPPFGNAAWTEISAKLESSSALVDGAWIYLESPGDAAPAVPIDWRLHREARSGNVRHVLYQRLGCP
ncbi:MAG: 16S rRNA (guanine(966)-N(2))-methyltransferase RsmD, partial [Dokdonella sp.]